MTEGDLPNALRATGGSPCGADVQKGRKVAPFAVVKR